MRGDYLMVLPLLFAPMLREVGSGDTQCLCGYSLRQREVHTLCQDSPRLSPHEANGHNNPAKKFL